MQWTPQSSFLRPTSHETNQDLQLVASPDRNKPLMIPWPQILVD
ncbi:unnamed protein product, partial [Arabidopsis halleri]